MYVYIRIDTRRFVFRKIWVSIPPSEVVPGRCAGGTAREEIPTRGVRQFGHADLHTPANGLCFSNISNFIK